MLYPLIFNKYMKNIQLFCSQGKKRTGGIFAAFVSAKAQML